MKKSIHKAISGILSLALLFSTVSMISIPAVADSDAYPTRDSGETLYLSEPFDQLENLSLYPELDAQIVQGEDRTYLSVKSSSGDFTANDAVDDRSPAATRQIDVASIPKEIYMVEFDVLFTAANCGAIQLYRGLPKVHLGPTIVYDGTNIKSMTGSNKYVTMFSNAQTNQWYNVKLIINSTSTIHSVVTDEAGKSQTCTSNLRRNFSKGTLGAVKIQGLSSQNPLYVDELTVYKPAPDAFTLTADETQVNIPLEGENTLTYSTSEIYYGDLNLTAYDPFASGLVVYKLYDEGDAEDLTDSMPQGVSIDAQTGIVAVDPTAQPGRYTVRAQNYTGTYSSSMELTITGQEQVDQVVMADTNPSGLPRPNEGAQSVSFGAVSLTQYGEEISVGDSYRWELVDAGGAPAVYEGVSVDAATGEVTVLNTAGLATVYLKATSNLNPAKSVVSDAIPMYQMEATRVEVMGDSYAKVVRGQTVTFQYTKAYYDQNEVLMPPEEKVVWSLKGASGGIQISQDGVLTVPDTAPDQTIEVVATSVEGTSGSKTVNVYHAVASDIEVKGNQAGVIPPQGEPANRYTYRAVTLDQYGFAFDDEVYTWSLAAEDAAGLSVSPDGVLTVECGAVNEQTVQVVATPASNPENAKAYDVIISEQVYTYLPVKGGFEIVNGTSRYTRPLYSSHVNDSQGTSRRMIGFVGDDPDFLMLQANKAKSFGLYAHMFLGIENGSSTKWLAQMDNIVFRYVYGRAEYEITDPSFDGTIYITYTRTDRFDGFLTKITLPDGLTDKLVVATAGDGGASVSQQTGGNTSGYEFKDKNAKSTAAALLPSNAFEITKDGKFTVSGSANVEMHYAVKDASKYSDLSALLQSTEGSAPMVVGKTAANTENDVYLLLTTDSLELEGIQEYLCDPKDLFEEGMAYFEGVSKAVDVNTPDPYFNSMIAAQTVAVDAAWINKTVMHGPIAWFVAHAGWRSSYGQTASGYFDRVETNAQQYWKNQKSDGRITAFPTSDKRYNMGEVLVDQYLYNWLYTGDLEEMRNGGYEFVTKHLAFMDAQMRVEGTNLYENFLNAWNTDNKWANGGPSTIASAYVWRACTIIADVAQRLGYTQDAENYAAKADAIAAEMKESLWSGESGVYAEYLDYYGNALLHDAPDLSSLYTPIDVGLTDLFEEYQMIHYGDEAIPNLTAELPRDAIFKECSNWLPSVYSSRGVYQGELANFALAAYMSGQYELADRMMRGIEHGLFQSKGAGPGLVSHQNNENGENIGHLDFADVSSMVVRTAVEGTFGIAMNVPDGTASITPGFPADWEEASIDTSYLGYSYQHEGATETLRIHSEKELSYQLSLKMRSADVVRVTVDGVETPYTIEAGVEHSYLHVTTPSSTSAQIVVEYGSAALPQLEADDVATPQEAYSFAVANGTISDVYDPQGVLASCDYAQNAASVTFRGGLEGSHTFFVLAKAGEASVWLPVNVTLQDAIELTGLSFASGPSLTFALANHTQTPKTISAEVSIGENRATFQGTIPALSTSEPQTLAIEDITGLGDGDNLVQAKITGDYTADIEGIATDWSVSKLVEESLYSSDKIAMVDLDGVVNQDLRTLHENTYTITCGGDTDYFIPNFYWCSDTTRSVTQTGRAWWEDSSRGKNGVPDSLNLPSSGGTYVTGAGIPFDLSGAGGKNAVFTSLYNQFPETVTIPVNETGQKIYFMVAVSTNHMQSYVENARITVHFADQTQQVLSLSNPENIDDWLNYQTSSSYAQSGYVQSLGSKAHANILSLDFGKNKEITSVELTCVANEVLAGILGITVVKGNDGQEAAADKTALLNAINAAAAYEGQEDWYTPGTWAVFDEAYETAKAVYRDPDADQNTVETAAAALQAAVAQLARKPYASADKQAYLPDEAITVTAVLPAGYEKVYLVNEAGNGLVSTRMVTDEKDGMETWELSLSLSSIGQRTLKLYADGADTGLTVSFAISQGALCGPGEPALLSAGISGSDTVILGEPFAVTVVTNKSTKNVTLFNESGVGLAPISRTYVDSETDEVRTWTLTFSVGTTGSRSFDVRLQNEKDLWLDTGAALSVQITR